MDWYGGLLTHSHKQGWGNQANSIAGMRKTSLVPLAHDRIGANALVETMGMRVTQDADMVCYVVISVIATCRNR